MLQGHNGKVTAVDWCSSEIGKIATSADVPYIASVPNPLFDLAGIMSGQFGIPFWKFFLATLFGKCATINFLIG
ncbi:hypothetical protein Lser_V15G06096 [Lactuca serriola]